MNELESLQEHLTSFFSKSIEQIKQNPNDNVTFLTQQGKQAEFDDQFPTDVKHHKLEQRLYDATHAKDDEKRQKVRKIAK